MGGLLSSLLRYGAVPAAEAAGSYQQGEQQQRDRLVEQARQDAMLRLQQQDEQDRERQSSLVGQIRQATALGTLKKMGVVPGSDIGDALQTSPQKFRKYGTVGGQDFYYDESQDQDLLDRQSRRALNAAHASSYLNKGPEQLTDDDAEAWISDLVAAGHDPMQARAAVTAFRHGDKTAVNPIINPKAPTATRTPDPSIGQRRVITTLDSQIGDATRQANTFQRRADASRNSFDPGADSTAKALGDSASTYNAKADSLRQKRDSVAAAQMGGPTGSAPAGVPGGTPRGPRRLAPDEQSSMQAEFDVASGNLTAILNSDAPPAVKLHARQLYNQHQAEIAAKYGVTQQ